MQQLTNPPRSLFAFVTLVSVAFATITENGLLAQSETAYTIPANTRDGSSSAVYHEGYDIIVPDTAQAWFMGAVTVPNNFYINGNGWSNNNIELFGAMRFAGSGYEKANRTIVSGNVVLQSNARIGTRNGDKACFGEISGPITGDFTLEYNSVGNNKNFSGSECLILTGTNSYGATTISHGTLQIGDGEASGTLGAGAVTMASGTTLNFSRSDDVLISSAGTTSGYQFTSMINAPTSGTPTPGTATITQSGAGTLTLDGNSLTNAGNLNYSASAGTITWQNIASIGSLTLSNNGRYLQGSVTTIESASVNGTIKYSELFQSGVTFTNKPSINSGAVLNIENLSADVVGEKVALNGGTLSAQSDMALVINGTFVENYSIVRNLPVQLGTVGGVNTVQVTNAADSVTFVQGIANADGFTAQKLVKSGSGKLILGAPNTNDGGIQVIGGTLEAAANVALTGNAQVDAGALVLNSGATLSGTATIASGASLKSTGLLTNTITGSGTYWISQPDGTKEIALSAANLATIDRTSGLTLGIEGFRAGSVSAANLQGFDIAIKSYGQLWIMNTDKYVNNISIEGIGWHPNERRGAIRFANASGLAVTMPELAGNVTLTGDASIFVHSNQNKSYAAISGGISGDHTLTLSGTGSADCVNHLVLTGTNSYGATTINKNLIVEIGSTGTLNGQAQTGTSGTLGTQSVSIESGSELWFNRTDNAYAFSESIVNNGAIKINSGTFGLTANSVKNNTLSGTGTTTIAAGATLKTYNMTQIASSQKLEGAGTWLSQSKDTSGSEALAVNADVSAFTGDIAIQNFRTSSINWDSLAGKTIHVLDSAQIWIQNGFGSSDLGLDTTTFDITGYGWKGTSTENRGAIRFGDIWNSAEPTVMQNLKSNVNITDFARIMAHYNDEPVHAALSGNISGGKLLINAQYNTDVLILLGANTYGETLIEKGVLQIGNNGAINSNIYDGTSGTLGTGKLTINSAGTLDYQRIDAYIFTGDIDNSGTIKISSGEFIASGAINNKGTIIVEKSGKFVGNGEEIVGSGTVKTTGATIEATPDDETGTLTVSKLTIDSGKILADIANKTDYDQVVVSNGLSIANGLLLEVNLLGDYQPDMSDVGTTQWTLLTGQADAFNGLDPKALSIAGSPLSVPDLFWTVGISADKSSVFASVGVPEPASGLLLVSAFALMGTFCFRNRLLKLRTK